MQSPERSARRKQRRVPPSLAPALALACLIAAGGGCSSTPKTTDSTAAASSGWKMPWSSGGGATVAAAPPTTPPTEAELAEKPKSLFGRFSFWNKKPAPPAETPESAMALFPPAAGTRPTNPAAGGPPNVSMGSPKVSMGAPANNGMGAPPTIGRPGVPASPASYNPAGAAPSGQNPPPKYGPDWQPPAAAPPTYGSQFTPPAAGAKPAGANPSAANPAAAAMKPLPPGFGPTPGTVPQTPTAPLSSPTAGAAAMVAASAAPTTGAPPEPANRNLPVGEDRTLNTMLVAGSATGPAAGTTPSPAATVPAPIAAAPATVPSGYVPPAAGATSAPAAPASVAAAPAAETRILKLPGVPAPVVAATAAAPATPAPASVAPAAAPAPTTSPEAAVANNTPSPAASTPAAAPIAPTSAAPTSAAPAPVALPSPPAPTIAQASTAPPASTASTTVPPETAPAPAVAATPAVTGAATAIAAPEVLPKPAVVVAASEPSNAPKPPPADVEKSLRIERLPSPVVALAPPQATPVAASESPEPAKLDAQAALAVAESLPPAPKAWSDRAPEALALASLPPSSKSGLSALAASAPQASVSPVAAVAPLEEAPIEDPALAAAPQPAEPPKDGGNENYDAQRPLPKTAREWVARSLQAYEAIDNYQAQTTWQVGRGEEASKASAEFSFRKAPHAVRLKMTSTGDKELLFVHGAEADQVVMAQKHPLGRLITTVAPDDPQLLKTCVKPLPEWGVGRMLDELQSALEWERTGDVTVEYRGEKPLEGAKLHQVVVRSLQSKDQIEYYFDSETMLPAAAVVRDEKGSVSDFERYAKIAVNREELSAPVAFDSDSIRRR